MDTLSIAAALACIALVFGISLRAIREHFKEKR